MLFGFQAERAAEHHDVPLSGVGRRPQGHPTSRSSLQAQSRDGGVCTNRRAPRASVPSENAAPQGQTCFCRSKTRARGRELKARACVRDTTSREATRNGIMIAAARSRRFKDTGAISLRGAERLRRASAPSPGGRSDLRVGAQLAACLAKTRCVVDDVTRSARCSAISAFCSTSSMLKCVV